MSSEFRPTQRTDLVRKRHRADYRRDTIEAIIDEAMVASVAIVVDGHPHVQPMIHARVGDQLVLHGHGKNRLLGLLAEGAEACINITLIDALVLARTIADHSLHFRSVTLFGRASEVTDMGAKLELMSAVFAAMVRSERFAALPPVEPNYLDFTRVLVIPISEAAAKVNREVPDPMSGPARLWSGLVPLSLQAGALVPDARTVAEGLVADAEIDRYRRRASG